MHTDGSAVPHPLSTRPPRAFLPASGPQSKTALSALTSPASLDRALIGTIAVAIEGAAPSDETNAKNGPLWTPRRPPRPVVSSRPADHSGSAGALPMLLTADDAANLLRTTRRAVYAMVERRQLPGVIRLRRRVLFRADVLLDWLDQKRAPSPEE